MIKYRKRLLAWLFEKSQRFYTRHFKKRKTPWGLSKAVLLTYPKGTLGHHLGVFLECNNFELIPKVERHDGYHVLSGYGTKAEDEVALQYLCFGNGKRTPYSLAVLLLGTAILPEYLPYYRSSFKIGKEANHFHNYDYKKLLRVPLKELRALVFSKKLQSELQLKNTNDFKDR